MTTTPTTNRTDLVARLDSAEANIRLAAATEIGTDQLGWAAELLVARFGTETDCQVTERFTWASVRNIDDALPALFDALASDEPAVRKQAAHVLSKAPRAEFAPRLIALVTDADAQVAIKAYRAAANTGAAEVVPALIARLGDGDAHQRDALTNALFTLAKESEGELAVAELANALSSPEVAVREHAAEALGQLGETAAGQAEALFGLANGDQAAQVRIVATSALGQLGEAAQPKLVELRDSSDATVAAIARSFS